jgi:SAM-dependent methyltransferase
MKNNFKKFIKSVKNLFDIFYSILRRRITLKYGLIRIKSLLTFTGRRFIDGVNWQIYHKHYAEELNIITKSNTILIPDGEIYFFENKIRYKDINTKPLLPNHELLYETILKINTKIILEAGCGGGDHLFNLHRLNAGLKLKAIELSQGQLDLFKDRHPTLFQNTNPFLLDLTSPNLVLPDADLVFTQAVLMHISEKDNRFFTAFKNLFDSKISHVVLMENWSQHHFLNYAKYIIKQKHDWNAANFYFNVSEKNSRTRCLVISKEELDFPLLQTYEDLLQGDKLESH